jgi:carbamoyl-phosphate synthase large subunit
VTKVLILGAGGSAAANVVDCLRRSEHSYSFVGADASPVKLHLSTCEERIVLPRATDPTFPDQLVGASRTWRCDIIHPQADADVLGVGRIREGLPALTYLPPQRTLELAADKMAFAERLRSKSVPVPDAALCTSIEEVVARTEKLLADHERVWVRARSGAGAKASLPVRAGLQAEAWVRWWVDERDLAPSDFMVSEFLPGREFAYQSVWQDGELVAGQARQRLDYLYGHLTPSGQTSTPAIARTVRIPAVDEVATRAIRALDPEPRGVYCVDLKEAADGQPKITEINAGRFFTTSNFFAAAGLNMPDQLMRCALGERPPRCGSSPLDPDLYWIRMVDMGYILVRGDELYTWPRADH